MGGRVVGTNVRRSGEPATTPATTSVLRWWRTTTGLARSMNGSRCGKQWTLLACPTGTYGGRLPDVYAPRGSCSDGYEDTRTTPDDDNKASTSPSKTSMATWRRTLSATGRYRERSSAHQDHQSSGHRSHRRSRTKRGHG
eukprot:PhF_6_TR7897/c0_g5_i3/m.11661